MFSGQMELPAAATLDLQGIYKIHVTVGFGKAEWYFFFFFHTCSSVIHVLNTI